MERKLKERLTGAIVLVLVGVVAIPALLDGPDDPTSVSRGLSLPSGSPVGETRTQTITLGEGRSPAAQPDRPALPVPAASPSTGPGVTDSAARPAAPAAARVEASVRKPATTPAAKPQVESPGWAVQVGSFSQEGNARRFGESLRNDGYRAFVVRNVVDGVVRFRVRVGPEPARERAEELAARLKADGHPTSIVQHP